MRVGACGNPVGLETGRRRQVVTRVQVEAEGERGRVEEGNGQDRTGQGGDGRGKPAAQQRSSGTCISTQLCYCCAALPQH